MVFYYFHKPNLKQDKIMALYYFHKPNIKQDMVASFKFHFVVNLEVLQPLYI